MRLCRLGKPIPDSQIHRLPHHLRDFGDGIPPPKREFGRVGELLFDFMIQWSYRLIHYCTVASRTFAGWKLQL